MRVAVSCTGTILPPELRFRFMLMRIALRLLLAGFLSVTCPGGLWAQTGLPASFQADFTANVQPFLTKYCLDCHGAEKPESMLNLARFQSAAKIAGELGTWQHVLGRVQSGEMPPKEATDRPSEQERAAVVKWIRALRADVARRNAGDPGIVPARRLSNAELNATIRDLTGVDLQPARDFPVDPANAAGFDNSAESLTVTPALLSKYLDAARDVTDHLAFTPHGFNFAPHSVISDPDRDKYAVNRIIAFYSRQKTNLADYFHAAWRHKQALARSEASQLDDLALQSGISIPYLRRIWTLLQGTPEAVGPIARLQQKWRDLPQGVEESRPARLGCERMRDDVLALRAKLAMEFENPNFRGLHAGSQPLVLRLNQNYATHRRSADLEVLQVEGADLKQGVERDPDLAIPADEGERARHVAAFELFAATFPDAFYVSERGRIFLKNRRERDIAVESGRLLSAGYHSMMGYFRDDQPLSELLLDDAGRAELDELWRELDFITRAPVRQHLGSIWFDRAEPPQFLLSSEFNHVRAEDQASTSEAALTNLHELYLAKAVRQGASEFIQSAIDNHFQQINASLRALEKMQRDAEPQHLRELLVFAERAWRRPLTAADSAELLAFYRSLRDPTGLDHEDAVRDVVASILASPRFWYRVDETQQGDSPIRPLDSFSLASRLSYFLWSSLPDEELLAHARAGDLAQLDVLRAQARRMMRDDRVRGLALEFGGNWLEVRRFEEHNSVDRGKFPTFTNDLRSAMFEEPVRYLTHLFQQDRPATDLLFGQDTFVNPVLAKHYGIPIPFETQQNQWIHVTDATPYHRGGLLPMAAFLTKNSPGLRTSPVKRGYWVVRRLLGQEIPPPPPNVPEIPSDETQLGALTLRETLALHRASPNCAVCHEKFDSFGLVFEGFGPVGEFRELDLGGRPVQTVANFPDGSEGSGLEGLQSYLKSQRTDDFVDNLSRKLVSYALSRSLLPSDDLLLEEIRSQMAGHGNRVGSAIETIVLSPQFRNKRLELELETAEVR